MKFKAVSSNNRKINLNMDLINVYCSRYVPGTPFDIEVVRRQKKISDPMRRYYFGVVLSTYAEHLGYDADENLLLHRQLKIVYFKVQPDEKGVYRNKDIPSVYSNESELGLSVKQEFTEWVKRKAAKDGVYVPDPGE